MKENEIGKMYGRWLVLESTKKTGQTIEIEHYFLCECQCKKKTRRIVLKKSLRSGASTSCGCINLEKSQKRLEEQNKKEIGKIYGKWLVLEPIKRPKHIKSRSAFFLCECQCQKKTHRAVCANSLRNGGSISCGCIKNEIRNINAPYNQLFRNYKHSATQREIDLDLTLEDIKIITQKKCYYCGREPSRTLKSAYRHSFFYNGIDRVDNTKGYIKSNCVPCCTDCNTAKSIKTFQEFNEWVSRVYFYLHQSFKKA